MFSNKLSSFTAVSVIVATSVLATGVHAQATADGRTGPLVFNDEVLNQSLTAMNDFLQARYVSEDMIASLSAPAEPNFNRTVATVVSVPEYRSGVSLGEFLGQINGGEALDMHLAAFNDDIVQREIPLFERIAFTSGGTNFDMREAGGLPMVAGDQLAFGPKVSDGVTLQNNLDILSDNMRQHAARVDELSGNGNVITGSDFNLYTASLKLF
ncbi:hypothetical protein [Shimia sp.]|uniref:hypothetical protein n=1 Tax=Shimia sp. TaxID=1954381 RepID=UPI003297C136